MMKRCIKIVVTVLAAVMLITNVVRAIAPEKKPIIEETVTRTVGFVEEAETLAESIEETTEATEVAVLTQPVAVVVFSDEDINALAKTLYGEANCVESEAERSMVIWTILNRYDAGGYGKTIYAICAAPCQFSGYDPDHPITDRNLDLVMDVIDRWERERRGEENVGRTLPREYCYFIADSNPSAGEWHNAFFAFTNGNRGEKIWYDYLNPVVNPYET